MNRFSFFSSVLAAAIAAVAPVATPAVASDAVLRCRTPEGAIGYTDRSCAVFGAEAVPVSAELLTRIARDAPGSSMPGGTDLDSPTWSPAAPGRRSPASGCARTPVQLAMDLQGALALGDVNRVAESYHFAGMSSKAGERALDRLQSLAQHQVLDSRYFDASIGGGGFADGATLLAGPGNGSAGILQLLLGNGESGGVSAIELDVHRYAGCYFVSF